jgi:predicted transcriptional regulator
MMEKRSSIDIVSHILEAANGGASKMQIMHRAVLSYKQMKEYANFLTERGLLTYDNSRQGGGYMLKTTEKGLWFIKTYNRLDDIIKEEETARSSL